MPLPQGVKAVWEISKAYREWEQVKQMKVGSSLARELRFSLQKNFKIKERMNAQLRWDMQNAYKTHNFTGPTSTVDFRNPQTFGKLTDDPRTASLGGQPLMNLTIMIQF